MGTENKERGRVRTLRDELGRIFSESGMKMGVRDVIPDTHKANLDIEQEFGVSWDRPVFSIDHGLKHISIFT